MPSTIYLFIDVVLTLWDTYRRREGEGGGGGKECSREEKKGEE